jgi:hypothetical protein
VLTARDVFVILFFVPHKQADHKAANDAYGKAQNIDRRKAFIAKQIANSCF